jgi:4-hydroxybenzoate polyprenyltransferase
VGFVGRERTARRPTKSADAQRGEAERRPEPERDRSGRAKARPGSALWRALRPHQWAKNLLLFVPLALTPAQVPDIGKWLVLFAAFACWSAVASAGYLANDALDVAADRADPEKRNRPFASGALSVRAGVGAGIAIGPIAVGLAAAVAPLAFVVHLVVYLALTLVYSLYVKRLLLLDVLLLAGLYTLRLLAGGAAVEIALTPWLLAFSLFFFLGLAFAKRYGELQRIGASVQSSRAYRNDDLDLLMTLGATSTYLSVLVLCLYINSDHVGQQYPRPGALWFLAPLLLYWVSRIWFLAKRGELPGDPVAFAVRDRVSLVIGALVAAVLAVAIVR